MMNTIADFLYIFFLRYSEWLWLCLPFFRKGSFKQRTIISIIGLAVILINMHIITPLIVFLIHGFGMRIVLLTTIHNSLYLNVIIPELLEIIMRTAADLLLLSVFFRFSRNNLKESILFALWHKMWFSCSLSIRAGAELLIYQSSLRTVLNDKTAVFLSILCSLLYMTLYLRQNKKMRIICDSHYMILMFFLILFVDRLNLVFSITDNMEFLLLSCLIPYLWTITVNDSYIVSRYRKKEVELMQIKYAFETELDTVQGYTEQISETRHTLLHHMNNLQKFIEQEDTKGAEIYIHYIMNEYSREEINYCENVYVNGILNYYAEKYPEIKLNVRATIGKDCRIRPMDIGLLVFVIMEEAVKEGYTEINLNVLQNEDAVTIAFTNLEIKMSYADGLMIQRILNRYERKTDGGNCNGNMQFILMNPPE